MNITIIQGKTGTGKSVLARTTRDLKPETSYVIDDFVDAKQLQLVPRGTKHLILVVGDTSSVGLIRLSEDQ